MYIRQVLEWVCVYVRTDAGILWYIKFVHVTVTYKCGLFTCISLLLHLCVEGHVRHEHDHLNRESPDSSSIVIAQYKLFYIKNWEHVNFLSAFSLIRSQLNVCRHVACLHILCLYVLPIFSPFFSNLWNHFISVYLTTLLFSVIALPPTEPTYSFIPTCRLSSTLSTPFQLLAHLLFSLALPWYSELHVIMCVPFHRFYFRTTSILSPTSGLPVCTAALHTAHFTTISQCCYHSINLLFALRYFLFL